MLIFFLPTSARWPPRPPHPPRRPPLAAPDSLRIASPPPTSSYSSSPRGWSSMLRATLLRREQSLTPPRAGHRGVRSWGAEEAGAHGTREDAGFRGSRGAQKIARRWGEAKEASRGEDVASGTAREEENRVCWIGFFTTANPKLPSQVNLPHLLEML